MLASPRRTSTEPESSFGSVSVRLFVSLCAPFESLTRSVLIGCQSPFPSR